MGQLSEPFCDFDCDIQESQAGGDAGVDGMPEKYNCTGFPTEIHQAGPYRHYARHNDNS